MKYKWEMYKRIFCGLKNREHIENIRDNLVLFDVSEDSDNIGDSIIMDYCVKICRDIFNTDSFLYVPTHVYKGMCEELDKKYKILCGTNILYSSMEEASQWALPYRLESYSNTCLLGVGWNDHGKEKKASVWTKLFLKLVLDPEALHSVRDESTSKKLREAGIKNVINTGCPTMWDLTKEFCETIPNSKVNNVLVTFTDYSKDYECDRRILEVIKKNYDIVYFWPQGEGDLQYISELTNINELKILDRTLEALDEVLKNEKVDYIGTRLHAGIRSLNFSHRSMVLEVDSRAKEIAIDTNLPTISRDSFSIESKLEKWIFSNEKTNICMPFENIEMWKRQFKENEYGD